MSHMNESCMYESCHMGYRCWFEPRSTTLHRVVCSVLQCGAVWCSVVQCVVVCCSVLQCVAVCCSVLQCVAACCTMYHIAPCCMHIQKQKLVTCKTESTPPNIRTHTHAQTHVHTRTHTHTHAETTERERERVVSHVNGSYHI